MIKLVNGLSLPGVETALDLETSTVRLQPCSILMKSKLANSLLVNLRKELIFGRLLFLVLYLFNSNIQFQLKLFYRRQAALNIWGKFPLGLKG